MKKKLVAIILCGLLILIFSACGGERNNDIESVRDTGNDVISEDTATIGSTAENEKKDENTEKNTDDTQKKKVDGVGEIFDWND